MIEQGINLTANLSETQAKAVTHPGGPLVVFAGAGSGKTRVLVHRIAWLIRERMVNPGRILAVTFTNKAAGEMRERVISLVPQFGEWIWISTFHSACVRILRRDAHRIGIDSNFVIYDDSDQRTLIKQVLKELGINDKRLHPGTIAYLFEQAKNLLKTPEEVARENLNEDLRERFISVYDTYHKTLRLNNAMDFGDLIVKTIELLEQSEELRRFYHKRLEHILVDEFQDTNIAQYRLLRLLCGEHNNVCVVGDDDQSIYRWRGAEIANILDFEKDYPGTTTVILGENYRSTANILQVAAEVISGNLRRQPKELSTANPPGDLVRMVRADDERDEGRYVARSIQELIEQRGMPYSSIAVFYRTNAQSRIFEEELYRLRIPFQVIGGIRFYDRMEIKDALAYLRLLVNPADSVSARRIVNVPPRGIGKATEDKIVTYAISHGLPFLAAARNMLDDNALKGASGNKVKAFLDLVAELMIDSSRSGPLETLRRVLDRTGYVEMLMADKSVEASARRENLDELQFAVKEFEKENPNGVLLDFIEQVALVADPESVRTEDGAVSLMTVHSAKGLEFPAVFVVGLEEGLFPHSRSIEEDGAIEEERRLFYVAVTRAKERLSLSYAVKRSLYGGRSQYTFHSRFLDDIPMHLVHRELDDLPAPPEPKTTQKPATNDFQSRLAGAYKKHRDEFDQRTEYHEEPEHEPAADFDEPVIDYSESQAEPSGMLRKGTVVAHPKFGTGVVQSSEGSGEYAVAVVYFNSYGVKKLRLAYARLRIIKP